MASKSIAGAMLALFASASHADVIVTGILDGTFSGGDPKVIELYISGSEDLSEYRLQRSANSGGFTSNISLNGVYSDQFVYLVNTSDLDDYQTIFGQTGDYANVITNGNISGNGNDAFRVVRLSNNEVIDQVDFGEDDQNTYQDSFLYRVDNTGPDGGFIPENWSAVDNNALDNATAAEIRAAVPFGSFATTGSEPDDPTDPIDPDDPVTPPDSEQLAIHVIQGRGTESEYVGLSVTTTGVVTGDFQGVQGSAQLHPQQLSGFFIQTPDDEVDNEPLTSEGLFIYCENTCDDFPVNIGDRVTVTGSVDERFGVTSLVDPAVVVEGQEEVLPSPASIDLPVSALTDFEPFEAMLVTFSDTLSVSEYFELGRFGQIVLVEVERPFQYTHNNAPNVEGNAAYEESLALRRIILDDDAKEIIKLWKKISMSSTQHQA
jgi:predicted extracellular nuclease